MLPTHLYEVFDQIVERMDIKQLPWQSGAIAKLPLTLTGHPIRNINVLLLIGKEGASQWGTYLDYESNNATVVPYPEYAQCIRYVSASVVNADGSQKKSRRLSLFKLINASQTNFLATVNQKELSVPDLDSLKENLDELDITNNMQEKITRWIAYSLLCAESGVAVPESIVNESNKFHDEMLHYLSEHPERLFKASKDAYDAFLTISPSYKQETIADGSFSEERLFKESDLEVVLKPRSMDRAQSNFDSIQEVDAAKMTDSSVIASSMQKLFG